MFGRKRREKEPAPVMDWAEMVRGYVAYCASQWEQAKADGQNVSDPAQVYYWRDFDSECFAEFVLDAVLPGWRDRESEAVGLIQEALQ